MSRKCLYALSTDTRMESSGDPEQLVNIQHIKAVLDGAREGQKADIQWTLKWLKPYIKCMMFLFKSLQVRTTNLNLLSHYFTPMLHNTGVNTFHCFLFRIVYLSFRFLFGIVFFSAWKRKVICISCLTCSCRVGWQPLFYYCRIFRVLKQLILDVQTTVNNGYFKITSSWRYCPRCAFVLLSSVSFSFPLS